MTKLRPLMLEHPIGQVHNVDEVSNIEDRLRLYSSARASDGQLFEGNSRPHRYAGVKTSKLGTTRCTVKAKEYFYIFGYSSSNNYTN